MTERERFAQRFPNRHPSTLHLLRQFEYSHLPPHLQEISARFHQVAYEMAWKLNDSPELSTGLRKLLEAKDCFVRAAVDDNPVDYRDR